MKRATQILFSQGETDPSSACTEPGGRVRLLWPVTSQATPRICRGGAPAGRTHRTGPARQLTASNGCPQRQSPPKPRRSEKSESPPSRPCRCCASDVEPSARRPTWVQLVSRRPGGHSTKMSGGLRVFNRLPERWQPPRVLSSRCRLLWCLARHRSSLCE